MSEVTVTVCAECLCACCWQAEFMCDKARNADITEKTIKELEELNLENPEYWKKDIDMKLRLRAEWC